MKHRFKAGDVIEYRFSGERCVAVIDQPDSSVNKFESYYFQAACNLDRGSTWRLYDGGSWPIDSDISDVRMHPDPDSVWAMLCAAKLVGDVIDHSE